ncbi:MAG: hypothetical protein P1V20_21845 [Verrucomicrobiales bacterium]|nr:hypothetical protein [Verrucomicrobiales bacterium]
MKQLLLRLQFVDLTGSLSTFYPSAIRMAGAAMQFLNTILIARKLGDEGSSTFFFWSAIIMTSSPMASYGLEQLALRDVPRLQLKGVTNVKSYLAGVRLISLALAFAIGLGLFIYAGVSDGWASWNLLIPLALAAMTTVLINGEVLKGLSHPVKGMFFGHFIPVSLFTLCVLLFVSISTVTPGSTEALDGTACIWLLLMWFGCFVAASLSVRFSGQPEFHGARFVMPDTALVKTLLKEGRSVFIGGIFGALSFLLPLALLKEFRPQEEVSYVTTAFRISILFNILSVAIHSVFAPRISRAAEVHDGKALFIAYSKAVSFSLLALGPPLIIGIIFPGLIMKIFGNSFVDGANTLRLLLAANLITLILGPVLQLLVMIGRNKHLPIFGAFKLVLAVVGTWILIPKFGGVGMVVGMSGAFLLEEIVVLNYIIARFRKMKRT